MVLKYKVSVFIKDVRLEILSCGRLRTRMFMSFLGMITICAFF